MKSMYGSRDAVLPALVAVALALVMSNILVNRVLPSWIYVPWNVLIAVIVLAVGTWAVSPQELGFGSWAAGWKVGGLVVAATLTLYLVAVALPATRDLFDDDRVDGRVDLMLYHAVLRIPLGTVLLEEVAFRSVLPALFAARMTGSRAIVHASVAASLLFGLWHVLPAWGLADVNPIIDDILGDGAAGQAVAIVFAVAGTFLAGMWLCALRYWSGSILAPVTVHIGTNSLAYALAWAVAR